MKSLGMIALAIGVLGLFVSLNMDTSVATGLGSRVNNIGLINDKQNLLLVFAVISVVGAIFLALGGRSQAPTPPPVTLTRVETSHQRKCPFCAEMIKTEASMCRFCRREMPVATAVPAIAPLALGFKVDTFAESSCVETLVALGYLVTRPTEDKWELVHPSTQVVAYAYSTEQLQTLTQRIARGRAVQEQA